MHRTKNQQGFTLLELLVVVILVAITAAIAVPNFSQLIESSRRTAVTNDLMGMLSYARSEAVKRGAGVEVIPEGGAFSAYLAVRAIDDESLRAMDAVPAAISVTRISGAGNLQFRANGLANETVRYRVCGESGSNGVRVAVNAGGQVRQENATENAGDLVCP